MKTVNVAVCNDRHDIPQAVDGAVFEQTISEMNPEKLYNSAQNNLGNYFRTIDEAEFAYRKQIVLQRLKDFALKNNDKKINWNDGEQIKYEIVYNHLDDEFVIWSCGLAQGIGCIYFTSIKVAKQAIESIGEENIKKYLFGIDKK